MQDIIYRIRNKPEKVRRHILHIITAVAGVILLMFWVFSLGRSLGNPEVQAEVSNDLKPLSALKANFIDGYKSISGSQDTQ